MPPQRSMRNIGGFAPDLDHISPNILLDANGFYPTVKGMHTLPQLDTITQALSEPCLGAASLTFSNNLNVLVAGTQNTLNVWNPDFAHWITTPLVGTLTVARWEFDIFQDQIIAVDGARPPYWADLAMVGGAIVGNQPITWQVLDQAPGGAFINSPAALVAASDFYLFLVPPNSATWWASNDIRNWVAGVGNVNITVTGTLSQTAGPITAAHNLRSGMVLYKENAIAFGQLVGPPLIWTFTNISTQVGTASPDGIVSIEDQHYFVGPDDWYSFDGYAIRRIPNAIREWFYSHSNALHNNTIQGRWDQDLSVAFWHYPSNGSLVLDQWIALNVRTNTWAPGHLTIECAVQGDPIHSRAAGITSGVFLPTHAFAEYGDHPYSGTDAFLLTGTIGDRHHMFQTTRVRPGYTLPIAGAPTIQFLNSYLPGGPYTSTPAFPLSADGWFNTLNTARMQRLQFNATDLTEIATYEIETRPAGDM